MRAFSYDPDELRYCPTQSTEIATADQLCYLMQDGWRIVAVNDELYLYSGRQVTLYIFTIARRKTLEYVAVVRNPFVEHLVHQFARYAARTPHIYNSFDAEATQPARAVPQKAAVTA